MNRNLLFLPFLGIFFAAIAAAVASNLSHIPWLPTVVWGLAGSIFVFWVILDFENFKTLFTKKGSKYGVSSGISAVLVIALITGLAFLSSKPRFNKSFDFTRSGLNTLSDQSLKMIENLKNQDQEITVIAFFQDDVQKSKFQNLIQLYEAKGLKAKVTYKDPQTSPTEAMAENITQGNTVIFKHGSQSNRITTFTEEKVTNALLSVQKDDVRKIFFTKGHGEGQLEGEDAEGFKITSEELKNNKYEVAELSLLETAAVPEDADLLVIAGPKYDFKDEEIKLLTDYLKSARPLLVMLDAMVPAPKLNELLQQYGIEFNNDLLILRPDDPRAQLLGQNNTIVSNFDDFNPITKDFARKSNVALLMPNTRSIKDSTSSNPNSMTVSLVAKTSEVIVGIANVTSQSDLKNITDERIKTGEFGVVAVASGLTGGTTLAHNAQSKKEDGAKTDIDTKQSNAGAKELRIVAVGSTQFANNLGAQRGENLDMFMNISNYLLQDENFISIRPKDPENSTIDLTSPTSQLTLMFLTYIFPFVFLGIGLVHWLRRRRA